MNLSLQMLKSSNSKRISHVWDARNCQLGQCNNARAVKDFTANGVLEQLKKAIPCKRKLCQRKKEEKREIRLLQLRKRKRSVLNQKLKFQFQRMLMEKLPNQKWLSKRKKRKLLKLQHHMLLLAATRNANLEILRLFQLDVSSEISWTLLNLNISAKMMNIRIINSLTISNKIAITTNNSSAHPKIVPTKNSWPKSNWRNIWTKIA